MTLVRAALSSIRCEVTMKYLIRKGLFALARIFGFLRHVCLAAAYLFK